VRIGVVFPQNEIGDDPAVIRSFATTAEQVGFDHMRVYDHVLGAVHADREPPLTGPYTEDTPFHEIFVLMGYLAALTSTIELASGVLVLPQRQTALVAKQAAEVDILSGGRLRLGVGTGWNWVEYDVLNETFSDRGRRQEEQIEVLRALWSSPVVSFAGKWHQIDRAGIMPQPSRQIPIWLGGYTEVVQRRAARIADGFIVGPRRDPAPDVAALRQFVEQEGRSVADFGIDVIVPLNGRASQWLEDAERLAGLGVSHLTIATMGEGLSPQQHVDELASRHDALRAAIG
jgi:probable F420-dependent oxidoreductase